MHLHHLPGESLGFCDQSVQKRGITVIQGNVGFDVPETEDDSEARLPGKDGYTAFLDALIAETDAFAGQVVLVHGDTISSQLTSRCRTTTIC